MTREQIIDTQKRIGTNPDGFWGPKSVAACQKHLRALMPKINQWPSANTSAMVKFYGPPGDESQLVLLDVSAYGIRYEGKIVKTLRCHRKVGGSLLSVIRQIHNSPFSYVLKEYNGCFNFRNSRGSSSLSKHAWGAAIDFLASKNGNKTHWPIAATMPIEVMEIFAREGWIAAGAFWSRDAMHFQATR